MQRERERERERFETDRGRDHGRRTIERSQSPSHLASRRPASPTASPSLSERIPSDSDRRICCRSSERSGSCSSISPPRFEKIEKARSERYNKTDKLEKDRIFELERGSLVEKEKRTGRKDRGDKDKSEKQRLKKLKVTSPIIQPCQTESELEKDVSPESVLRNKTSKISKEGSSKGRLDLLPCVVQLTRVKEKEGKLIGHPVQEKQILRGGNDSPRLVSPSADQRSPPFRSESLKSDIFKHGKVHRDKNMHSLIEFIDKDAKIKSKKHGKSEMGFDSGISVDIDRLAARKRRFEDPGKADRQKRTSEEDLVRHGLHKLWNSAKEMDFDKNLLIKGMHKKEHHKDKSVRMISVNSPKDGRECENNSIGLPFERQSQIGEVPDDSRDQLSSPYLKIDLEGSKSKNSSSLTKISDDDGLDLDELKEQQKQHLSDNEQGTGKCRDSDDGDEHFVHTEQNNISKHIDQSRWLRPKLGDPDKLVKYENPPSNETCDFEKDYIVHAGKSIRDMPNDDFSCKRKKLENFDFEMVSAKRERNFASSQKLNEDIYQNITSSISRGHFSENDEDETSVSSINKERKPTPPADDKFSPAETLKNSFGLTNTHFQSSETELPKIKTNLLSCDEELMQRWERRMKSDSVRMEMTFSSDIAKCENIRKCLSQDLEPGEVQSDSDDDAENKHTSTKSSTSLSYILRERDERMTDLKLSGSLEKNKFYSFALDKTITPDTKALLERAKTLYSSREDNWSFLPSRFPTSHSCSDKDKVELAPRPIPSWYMKKKKIRTDSDEKLHDKKEELKPQDQEKQDLFASRFLHSSIFEQDSRRLQHLERKDQDLETGVSRSLSKPGANETQPDSGISDIPQEPIVLFHSRFLELQQQKDKDHPLPDTENDLILMEIKRDEVQHCHNTQNDKESEPLLKIDDKSVSPPVTPHVSSPKEMSTPEKKELLTPSSEQPMSFVKEEKVEEVLEVSSSHYLLVEDCKPVAPKLSITPPPVLSEPENEVETKAELFQPKVKIGDALVVEHSTHAEDNPPTPGGSLSGFDKKTAELPYSDYPKIEEKPEIVKTEPKIENQETKNSEESQKAETDSEVCMPELEAEIKPLPNRRQPKSKRTKQVSGVRTSQSSQNVAAEKPATRKSERIDREKLKRASSPRAEVPKTECKITSKSPIHASDSEQNLESSLIHGRTRRRNVRSVYATLHEDDQAGKEAVESPRSMRKRAADKDSIQQDVQIPSTNTRRGRPPKRAVKRSEDVSPSKGDQQKIIEEDTEVKETSTTAEISKASEGWRSPRTQKLQQTQLSSSAPVIRKGGRLDKQFGSTNMPNEQSDLASHDEAEVKTKPESEIFGKLSEKMENTSSPVHNKEKDVKDYGGKQSVGGNLKNVDSSCSDRKQLPEKSVKVKMPRLKRNAKQVNEDKSHSLKNLEIRVSVDDVKGLLHPEVNEPEFFEAPPITKTKTVAQETKETKAVGFPKESPQSGAPEKEDTSSESELPDDPAALLAQQIELERAVENIAKLTVEQLPRTDKEQSSGQPTTLPPAIVEPEGVVEEEKRANPASETELAAAIDSITAEEICADTDGFTAPPTYTALIPTPDSVVSPSSNEIMEPETHMIINSILAADSDDSPLTHSPPRVMAESKTAEDTTLLETPKKTGKVRAKTPKKSRGRKGAAAKKGDTAEEVSQPDPSPVKLPESIPDDPEIINSKAVTVAGATAAASVVTAVATCRRDVTSAITVDTPKEAEQPDIEQPVPKESAFHSGTSNSTCKKQPQAAEPCTPTIAPVPSCPQPVSQFSVPLLRPAKMPLSQDWPARTEESRIYVAPSCHVTVVTPSAPALTTLGTPSSNPPKPPDTKASDIDPSSSTLRKILMEPKYVSASNSNSVPTTIVTSALSDPSRMSENENPSDTMGSRLLHSEERPALTPQPIHHKPFPLSESQQNCGEKTQHTVISPATSVISRIPMPYDTEETPRISLSNRSTGLSIPKQKFRSNSNENNRYHGMDIVGDGTRGRSVVETTPYSTGAGPGLRVNTSEGVVVLSYSGQKTEGPHRMRARISQIPQASAGDVEFQQSVSKSSLKQDPLITSSQSLTPKASPTPSSYGHTGVLLTGQSYNSQPVISSTKQENLGCDKSDALYHTTAQGGVVKMFQQPVSSPQVLMYNMQHGKRGIGTEPLTKKMDLGKTIQQPNLSPVMSPHHSSLSGTRMSPSPGIPPDRSSVHLKQEPQSPRTAVHSPLPFVKSCPPSSSPRGPSVVLGHGMAQIPTYHSGMHQPHSEQSSVIIQPHSVTQSMAHEARMNTTPMSGINYGRRGDSLSSPHAGPPQRSNTPQPNLIRDMVLQSHSSPQGAVSGGGGTSVSEEDPRHFNPALSRPSVPQLQSEVMMIHSDHRGLHPSIRMDQYRDMHQRILMHQQLGEQAAVEARQSRTLDPGTPSSSNISGSAKSPVVGKSIELSTKESLKPLEGKLIHPPSSESRIRGVHASSPVVVSPHPHGVQLMCPGSGGSFPVYRDMRGFPSQFPGHSSSGHNLANQGITSSQVEFTNILNSYYVTLCNHIVKIIFIYRCYSCINFICFLNQVPPEPELGHRSKMSQSHGGGSDSKPENSHLRHANSTDLSHISRVQGDTISPSYQSPMTSPMGLAYKPDLSLQNGPPAFLPTPPPSVPPSSSLQPRPEAKLDHSGHRSIDTVQLLTVGNMLTSNFI